MIYIDRNSKVPVVKNTYRMHYGVHRGSLITKGYKDFHDDKIFEEWYRELEAYARHSFYNIIVKDEFVGTLDKEVQEFLHKLFDGNLSQFSLLYNEYFDGEGNKYNFFHLVG